MSAEDYDINMSQEEFHSEIDFWGNLIFKADGELSELHVLQELHDYRFLMEQAATVYANITCSQMSRTTYYATDVIQVADECQDRIINDVVLDVLARIEDGETIEDLRKEFFNDDD